MNNNNKVVHTYPTQVYFREAVIFYFRKNSDFSYYSVLDINLYFISVSVLSYAFRAAKV